MNKKTLYMHTQDDRPASFNGSRVTPVLGRRKLKLCNSLQEIRDQQEVTHKWRERYLRPTAYRPILSYVLVEIGLAGAIMNQIMETIDAS